MDIKEVKKIIRGNAFKESHLSPVLVVDLEMVIDTLDDLASESNDIHDVMCMVDHIEDLTISKVYTVLMEVDDMYIVKDDVGYPQAAGVDHFQVCT